MQATSGNINDHEGFKNIVKNHLSSLNAALQCSHFISDATLYTAETIQSLDEQDRLFISRSPQKLTLIKLAIAQQQKHAFGVLQNGYSGVWLDSDYG
jgi:transposase